MSVDGHAGISYHLHPGREPVEPKLAAGFDRTSRELIRECTRAGMTAALLGVDPVTLRRTLKAAG